MKNNICLLFCIFLLGCVKDKITISNTQFENTTSHSVKVDGYKNGLIQTESSFVLNANESKQVFHLNNGGIGSGLTFGGYNQPLDSFVVIFDNTYRISHYKPNLIGTNNKRYLYSSKRNIYNDSSYVRNLLVDKKYKREWDFKYTFIEQDYLDAR
jgi:hypothetical protein